MGQNGVVSSGKRRVVPRAKAEVKEARTYVITQGLEQHIIFLQSERFKRF